MVPVFFWKAYTQLKCFQRDNSLSLCMLLGTIPFIAGRKGKCLELMSSSQEFYSRTHNKIPLQKDSKWNQTPKNKYVANIFQNIPPSAGSCFKNTVKLSYCRYCCLETPTITADKINSKKKSWNGLKEPSEKNLDHCIFWKRIWFSLQQHSSLPFCTCANTSHRLFFSSSESNDWLPQLRISLISLGFVLCSEAVR